MGGRRPRSPRKSARCSTNLTRGRPSSSTTRRVTAVRSSPRTRVRRLPDRRRLPGVWPPAGVWEPVAVGTQTGSARTLRRAAGRSRRRQLRPAGAEGSSPESLRGARRQARGHIANENCLTAGSSAPRRGRQLLYFQYMSYCSRRRKTTACGNFLRHFVTGAILQVLRIQIKQCPSIDNLLFLQHPPLPML